jgi:hypothetical protein
VNTIAIGVALSGGVALDVVTVFVPGHSWNRARMDHAVCLA